MAAKGVSRPLQLCWLVIHTMNIGQRHVTLDSSLYGLLQIHPHYRPAKKIISASKI